MKKSHAFYWMADILILLIIVGFLLVQIVFKDETENTPEAVTVCTVNVRLDGFPQVSDPDRIFRLETELYGNNVLPIYLGDSDRLLGYLAKTETGYCFSTTLAKTDDRYSENRTVYSVEGIELLPGTQVHVRISLAEFTLTVLTEPEVTGKAA